MTTVSNINRKTVVIVAYECSPVRQHAAGSAWKVITRLQEVFDLVVYVEENQYSSEIRQFVAEGGAELVHCEFRFIPSRTKPYGRNRPIIPIRSAFFYRKWLNDVHADLLVRSSGAAPKFDAIHLLRSDSFRDPGSFFEFGVPFVWGPVGGLTFVPIRFLALLPFIDGLKHFVRLLINELQLKSFRVSRVGHLAAVIFAQTSYDKFRFERAFDRGCFLVHEQGTDSADDSQRPVRSLNVGETLNVLWVGRLVSLKALAILIRAVSRCSVKSRIRVFVVGDGPMMAIWRALVEDYFVSDSFEFLGWKTEDEVAEMMLKSHLLAFTSLLEATSASVMKSLSLGLPVMCMRHCGFGDVVNDSCGWLAETDSPSEVESSFSGFLEDIIANPAQISAKSNGAFSRSRAYSWDRLANQIADGIGQAIMSYKKGP